MQFIPYIKMFLITHEQNLGGIIFLCYKIIVYNSSFNNIHTFHSKNTFHIVKKNLNSTYDYGIWI